MGGGIEHVQTLGDLAGYIDRSPNPLVVIDFHATWCPPCHAIAPFYEEKAAEHPHVTFLKCDVDAAQKVSQAYQITAMCGHVHASSRNLIIPRPTFVFIKDGREVERVRGSSTQGIEAALEKYATAPPTPSRSTSSSRWVADGPAGRQEFFSLLDQYFKRRGRHVVVKARSSPAPPQPGPRKTVAVLPSSKPEAVEEEAPPPVLDYARPSSSASASTATGASWTLSHPDPVQRSCAAEDAAAEIALMQPSSAWWEANPPQPHCLKNRKDMAWTMSMMQRGSEKTVMGAALFADLSMLWYRVSWTLGSRDLRAAQREALFSGRPPPLDAANLDWAAQVYLDTVASFAEQAEASRQPVGDGECWTLAAEALKTIDGSLPPHVPSISRTHGSLIYEGKATGKGKANQVGRCRGGDIPRRGDIVEWRLVKIDLGYGHAQLGAPDHTAVIVRDASPARQPADGLALAPHELGSLEVIEQSAGQVPKRATYKLDGMTAGEVWIYRPCAFEQLGLPSKIEPAWPPPVPTRAPSQ